MGYIVSVVVPTKNRYQYLKYLIQMIDGFNLPELELVIQDNSDDNNEILSFLKDYHSENIKYYYSSDHLTMSQNGELAINNATGEFVCYIGDDDGVCRNIVECAKWMKTNNILAAYNDNVNFGWGKMVKYRRPYNGYHMQMSRSALERLFRRGMHLMGSDMPLIYHGIVNNEVLKRIKQKYGTLFPSVPPDISGTICLAVTIDSYYKLYTPVIINGASAMTGGGVWAKGGVIPLQEVGFIEQKDIDAWDCRIPPIWVGNYAWMESAIKTINHVCLSDYTNKINFEYCFAIAVTRYPFKHKVWEMGWKYSKSKIKYLFLVVLLTITNCFSKLRNNLPWNVLIKKDVQNISEAECFLMKYAIPFE